MNGSPGGALDPAILDQARSQYGERFDKEWGGFSMRPKFPVAPNLSFLLRHHLRSGDAESLAMVGKTLTEIRRGGVYVHVGHGIHRYSTDREWLVPHFEKMLYDQALYVIASLEAWQVTGKEEHARNAREVLEYVARDMTSETGGFYSAEDATARGRRASSTPGRSPKSSKCSAGGRGWFATTFRIEDEGNYLDEATHRKNGTNIPHLRADLSDGERKRFEPLRKKLWERRETRVHPQKDDKILTDWNGLMISAYAKAAQALGDDAYAVAAKRAADFVLEELTTEDGRLLKRYRQGEAGLTAHLEDYAFFIRGLLDLYETNFDTNYLEKALGFQKILDERFRDEAGGGYFTVADDSEALIVRAKKLYGGAIPSGNAVTLGNLSRLHRMTGNPVHAEHATALIRASPEKSPRSPRPYPETLCGLDLFFGPTREIVISGKQDDPGTRAMIAALRKGFRPNQVVLLRTPENAAALARLAPFTETQTSLDGKATAYVCRDFACQAPTTEIGEMMNSVDAK